MGKQQEPLRKMAWKCCSCKRREAGRRGILKCSYFNFAGNFKQRMEIIYLLIGLIGGSVAGYYIFRALGAAKVSEVVSSRNAFEQKVMELQIEKRKLQDEWDAQNKTIISLTGDLARSKAEMENLGEKLKVQKGEVEELQQKFTSEFRNLANEILEEKSKRFTEQNKTNIDEILKPLGEKIKDFEKKVEETYDKELREKVSLRTEIKGLFDLNKQLSEEANNLARALKGDSKQQGNWGELILEKILEKSGLVKDREYKLQVAAVNIDGRSIQPDAIIYLPDNKHIIIDSKVSLVGYEQAVNAATEEDRIRFLKDHLQSVRTHVKQLSDKKYHTAFEINSPDFVFLFMWSEAAFSAALQADAEIFNYAWERKIAVVSPTTIWANLKTISNLWRIENQNRNAEEIARQGADLYDKFVGFVDDLIAMGKKLEDAKKSYEDSMKKLTSGSGNLVRRTEKMKELGLKTSKSLPPTLIDRALD
jgi:DNA recombination protein RmuC